MKFTSIFLSIAFIIYTGCEQEFVKDWDNKPQDMTEAMGGVPDSLQAMNLAPLVKGYYDGAISILSTPKPPIRPWPIC